MACFRYGSAYPQAPGVGVSGHSYRLPDHPTESGQTAALPTRVTQDLPDRGQVSRTCEYLYYQNVAQFLTGFLSRGIGMNISREGVVLNRIFQKGYFCIDLFPNTLDRKYIKFASFLRPWYPAQRMIVVTVGLNVISLITVALLA